MQNDVGKALAIAGFVSVIVGLVLSFLAGWFSIIALPISVTGLVLGIIGGQKLRAAGQPTGLATAALVVGIIAVVFSTISFFTCGICVLVYADTVNTLASNSKYYW